MVKSCVNASSFGSINSLSVIIMCPVDEIGKNSVIPSTIAIIIPSIKVMRSKIGGFISPSNRMKKAMRNIAGGRRTTYCRAFGLLKIAYISTINPTNINIGAMVIRVVL